MIAVPSSAAGVGARFFLADADAGRIDRSTAEAFKFSGMRSNIEYRQKDSNPKSDGDVRCGRAIWC
jgi:hypothetical protein